MNLLHAFIAGNLTMTIINMTGTVLCVSTGFDPFPKDRLGWFIFVPVYLLFWASIIGVFYYGDKL